MRVAMATADARGHPAVAPVRIHQGPDLTYSPRCQNARSEDGLALAAGKRRHEPRAPTANGTWKPAQRINTWPSATARRLHGSTQTTGQGNVFSCSGWVRVVFIFFVPLSGCYVSRLAIEHRHSEQCKLDHLRSCRNRDNRGLSCKIARRGQPRSTLHAMRHKE